MTQWPATAPLPSDPEQLPEQAFALAPAEEYVLAGSVVVAVAG
jgi:hypothetical protein